MKNQTFIKLTIFLCLLILNTNLKAQDIIKKTDGSEIKAKILEINKTEVKYKRFDYLDGPTVVLPIAEINLIKYPNGTTENFNKQNTNTNSSPTQNNTNTVQNSNVGQNGFTNKDEAKNETINGLKQGKWIEYFDKYFREVTDTSIASYYRLVVYIDGNFTETERLYYLCGKLRTETPYINGKGINKTFWKNGNLQNEMHVTNGKLDGTCKMYFDNGFPIAEYTYINGIKSGWEKNFDYNTGKLIDSTFVKAEQPVANFPDIKKDKKTYYDNGKLKSQVTYRSICNDSGVATIRSSFIDSVESIYFENGKLKSQTDYSKMYGNSIKLYNENGQLISDILNGNIKLYNENGQLISDILNFDDGCPFIEKYYSDGNWYLTKQYWGGSSHGNHGNIAIETTPDTIKTFVNDGTTNILKAVAPYKNGKLNGILLEFDSFGKLLNEIPYKDGKKNGVEKYYFTNKHNKSLLLQETPYVDDQRNGIEKSYNLVGGKLCRERTFVNDNVVSEQKIDSRDWGEKFFENIDKNAETIRAIATQLNNITNNNTNNSQLKPESAAITNGGNKFNTNAGAAKKCADDTNINWKGTREYNDYINNPNCNKMAYISQKKLAEMLLQSCSQYLPQSEIDGFNKTISSLQSTINGMENCKTYNYGK